MPWFALIGRVGARGRELRGQHREAHLAHLAPLAEQGRVIHGGPLLDEKGDAVGSLIVFEAASLEDARRQAQGDPYVSRGVFESYELLETRVVFPKRDA